MKNKSNKILITILLIFTFVATISLTSGKYVYNSVWNYYLKSKGFYFESDLLEINTKKNSNLRWDGDNVYFVIKNSLNNELISDYDISYSVSCVVLGEEASYIDCVLNGQGASSFNGVLSSGASCVNEKDIEDVSLLTKSECELNGYKWSEEITSKNNYFNLVLKDPTKSIDEVSVKIVAESLTPYHKTLSGVFNLNKIEKTDVPFVMNYDNYGDYDKLSITNTTTADACFSIGFNSNDYLFDIEENKILNYNVDSNKKVNEIYVKVSKQNTDSYNFYKTNSNKEYSISDFTIEEKEC